MMIINGWSAGHSAEGYAVIKHDDYGEVPAWNNKISAGLVELLNKGTDADFETVRRVVETLGVGATTKEGQ